MMKDELLRISSGEDRTGALRACVQSVILTGSRFDRGSRRRGRAAPWAKAHPSMNLSPAARLRRAAGRPLLKAIPRKSQVSCMRAAGAHAAILPSGMRSIAGGEEEAA